MIALLVAALSLPAECSKLGAFYWEIGDANSVLASGVRGHGIGRDTVLPIASSTKWLFAAYVAQTQSLDQGTRDALRMLSGWTQMRPAACIFASTVESCMAKAGGHVPANDGRFFYNGGHYQHWAAEHGLGPLSAAQLGERLRSVLGVELEVRTPQPAGGAALSAAHYADFLRKLLKHELVLGSLLGKDPVGADAVYSPAPASWRYSYGHWIEDDGTDSSPGLFGYYPWIKGSHYGLVARRSVTAGAWQESALCGRALRAEFEKQ